MGAHIQQALRDVSRLSGPALDWAVAKAMGVQVGDGSKIRLDQDSRVMLKDGMVILSTKACAWASWEPTRNWAQMGPQIEAELIQLEPAWHNQHCAVVTDWQQRGFAASHGWHWQASILGPNNQDDPCTNEGGTPLIAACRTFVESKIGKLLRVPVELLKEE